jgi:hypothetical protein
MLYLIALTGLYSLLKFVYSNWTNLTVILVQAVLLLVFGPSLIAIWFATFVRYRYADDLVILPRWTVAFIFMGIAVDATLGVWALVSYPWPSPGHSGPAAAVIFGVSIPALVVAVLYVRDSRRAHRAIV